jgi:hypothetical protein
MENICIPTIDPYLRIIQKLFNKISRNYEKMKDIKFGSLFVHDCAEQFPSSNITSLNQCLSQSALINRFCELTYVKVWICLLCFILDDIINL